MHQQGGAGREMFGLSAALTTPFNEDLSIDFGRLASHARHLLDHGCASVTLFGTTGEGVSLCQRERVEAQAALVAASIDPARIVVGVSGTAVETAAEQAASALDAGIRTLLVPPPFYFKGMSDEGLFAWYTALLDSIAPRSPRVILYHIPQVTAVGLSLTLVRRLKRRYGEIILGVKDSAGHWPTTEALLGERDVAILVGDERHLAAAVRLGGGGAISGMANLFPMQLAELVRTGMDNSRLNELVDAIVETPVTPAVKALVGLMRGEEGWGRVRAPLDPMPAAGADKLGRLVDGLDKKRAA